MNTIHHAFPFARGAAVDTGHLVGRVSTARVVPLVEDIPLQSVVPPLPAITEIARDRGIKTGIDNTWATPLLFRPGAVDAPVADHISLPVASSTTISAFSSAPSPSQYRISAPYAGLIAWK